jgi:hypothetical protein
VKAAFQQQRAGFGRHVVGLAEAAEVAHAHAVLVTGVDDDVAGRAQAARQIEVALVQARQQQGRAGLVHGVQIQQPAGALHEGRQRGGAPALQRVGRLDALGRPLAVQVLLDEARRVGVGGVEAVERGQVAKRQRQRAARRTQAGLQQAFERPGAAQLVAVDQRTDQHGLPLAPLSKCHTPSTPVLPARQGAMSGTGRSKVGMVGLSGERVRAGGVQLIARGLRRRARPGQSRRRCRRTGWRASC